MTSVQHKVEMSHLATERRAAGKKTWAFTVHVGNVLHERDDFVVNRDALVRIIKASHWFRVEGEGSDLHELLEEMAEAESVSHFNDTLDGLYDLADYDRVWLASGNSQSGNQHAFN